MLPKIIISSKYYQRVKPFVSIFYCAFENFLLKGKKKMKKMFRIMLMIAVACLVLGAFSGCSGDGEKESDPAEIVTDAIVENNEEDTQDAEADTTETEDEETEDEPQNVAEKNDKIVNDDGEEFIVDLSVAGEVKADAEPLSSSKIELAGVSYSFPIRMSELLDNRWTLSNGYEYQTEFDANSTTNLISYYLRHESGMEIKLGQVVNDSDEKKDIKDCLLTDIWLDGYYYADDAEYVLPGGILPQSSAADVIDIFGNPNATDEFTGYSYNLDAQLTYTEHSVSGISYSFTFYEEEGLIYSIHISSEK